MVVRPINTIVKIVNQIVCTDLILTPVFYCDIVEAERFLFRAFLFLKNIDKNINLLYFIVEEP